MRIVALVPVNALHVVKSRLAAVLTLAERGELVLWLLRRVCDATMRSGVIDCLAVVSPDAAVLGWAEERGHAAIHQRSGELNAALDLGRASPFAHDADALLVLLGDLPLLAPEDVRLMCDLAAELRNSGDVDAARGAVVLAPDRSGRGTNGLLVAPPAGMSFAFGEGSYARHAALARERHLATGLYISPRTAFDVDGPGDLAEIRATELWQPDGRDGGWMPAATERTDGRAR